MSAFGGALDVHTPLAFVAAQASGEFNGSTAWKLGMITHMFLRVAKSF
jgi:hypothetical protein